MATQLLREGRIRQLAYVRGIEVAGPMPAQHFLHVALIVEPVVICATGLDPLPLCIEIREEIGILYPLELCDPSIAHPLQV